MMTQAMVIVRDLCVGYHQKPVLSQLNFTIQQGEIITFLGGSGCGKTTLMMSLVGLQAPISGEILIQGVNVAQGEIDRLLWLKQNTGVMFQSGALLSNLTLLENVMLPLTEHADLPPALIKEIALAKLRLVNLGAFAHYYPANISGGMIKRTAIARAMALDPAILFLDEPSAGLDPISRVEIDQLIYRLSRDFGITFVMITHELATIHEIADRGIVFQAGGIIADGPIETIKQRRDHTFIKGFFHSRAKTNE